MNAGIGANINGTSQGHPGVSHIWNLRFMNIDIPKFHVSGVNLSLLDTPISYF